MVGHGRHAAGQQVAAKMDVQRGRGGKQPPDGVGQLPVRHAPHRVQPCPPAVERQAAQLRPNLRIPQGCVLSKAHRIENRLKRVVHRPVSAAGQVAHGPDNPCRLRSRYGKGAPAQLAPIQHVFDRLVPVFDARDLVEKQEPPAGAAVHCKILVHYCVYVGRPDIRIERKVQQAVGRHALPQKAPDLHLEEGGLAHAARPAQQVRAIPGLKAVPLSDCPLQRGALHFYDRRIVIDGVRTGPPRVGIAQPVLKHECGCIEASQ